MSNERLARLSARLDRLFHLVENIFAACCSSGLRTTTFEIALRTFALLSLDFDAFFCALTAACKIFVFLDHGANCFSDFFRFRVVSFGPLFPMMPLQRIEKFLSS